MFTYTEEDIGIRGERFDEISEIALNTDLETEMFEVIKYKNPFLNRILAQNKYITAKVIDYLLDNHSAYTMNIYLAKNKNLEKRHIDKLYKISETEYSGSLLKSDLNEIFSKKELN